MPGGDKDIVDPVEVAAQCVGFRELSGNNDGDFVRAVALEEGYAWCAAFVVWCYDQAGIPLHRSLAERYQMRSVTYLERVFSEREGLLWLPRTTVPERGDVIFYGDPAGSDVGRRGRHCGLVERVTRARVYTIEGNLGNAVKRRSVWRRRPSITGYGRLSVDDGGQAG